MSPGNKRAKPARARTLRSSDWGGASPLFAGLLLLLALASPALRAPTNVLMTGSGAPGSEIRPFSLLALGAERMLAPGNQPAAWPGYPRATEAPADTPGPLASLIAVPAIALGEPVLAWNITVVLIPWLTFLVMFLLCRICTEDPIAAAIAGLGYVLQPAILLEPTATFLLLSPLLPASIIGTGGLMTGSPRQAFALLVGVAIALGLAPLPIACASVAAGGLVVLHLRPADRTTAGKIMGCLALFLILKFLFNPQLLLPAKPLAFAANELRHFLPGGLAGPSLLLTGLALIGIVDRATGPRSGPARDPRVLLFGTLVAVPFLVADHLSIGDGTRLTLPGGWLGARYPVVESLRDSLRLLLPLSWSLLAAFGGLAIFERVGATVARRTLAAVLLAGLVLGNLFWPIPSLSVAPAQVRRISFLSPPAEEAQLLQKLRPGAVLDLPTGVPDPASHRLLTAAWHRHATIVGSVDGRDAAQPLAIFAAAIDQPDQAEALASLGFGNVLIHKHDLSPEAYARFLRSLARGAGARGRLTTRFESPAHLLLGLQGEFPTAQDYDVLESNQPSDAILTLSGKEDLLVFELKVRGETNFNHPNPESETPLRVAFFDFRGRLVSEHLALGFLPMAVAHGGTGHTALRVPLPESPGTYTATLAPQSDPSLTLAIQSIAVAARE